MPNKEMTTETRLLLAFVLVGIVLVGWNYIYKPPPPPVTAPAETTQPAQPATEAPKVAQVPPLPPPKPVEVPGQVQASQAEEFTIETDFYRVRFSNEGAVVRSWILKKYKDGKGQPLELVNTRALSKVPAPFAVAFRNQAPPNDPNKGLFKVERNGDLGVTFEYSDGRTATKKTFQFMPKSYLVEITSQVIDNGVLLPHELDLARRLRRSDHLESDQRGGRRLLRRTELQAGTERLEIRRQRPRNQQRPVLVRRHRRQLLRRPGSSHRAERRLGGDHLFRPGPRPNRDRRETDRRGRRRFRPEFV